MNIKDILGKRYLIADGGMGTVLQGKGLLPGESPEEWNILKPEEIYGVHKSYFLAGSDYVLTNTFGANAEKYHGKIPLNEVVAAAVTIAKKAAEDATRSTGRQKWVALDVGPTGRLIRDGDFSFDESYDAFAAEITAGCEAGADFVVIETMGDTLELKAAVLAARENSSLPVFATVALGEDGKLLTGADVEAVAVMLEGLRVDALGFNCGLGPDLMRPFVRRLANTVSLPIIVKANAGMPHEEEGRTVFDVTPNDFAQLALELIEEGATIIGGCCGTTPGHIEAVAKMCASLPLPKPRKVPSRGVISSGTHALEIALDDTVVVGERINPTGKKKLKQALVDGDMAYVLREAIAEGEAGAQILDVNVGVPGNDEAKVLESVVKAVQGVSDLPLQIDTADSEALARAMRVYNGKPLVNSVNGKEESLSTVLPIAAKYGGLVVALTLDESGIPPTAQGRLEIAKKIIARGAEYGLKPTDFIIDVLCMAVSADQSSGNTVLEALKLVRQELNLPTILGVSNISFGLPARSLLNSTFYSLAIGQGLSAAIINPLSREMMATYHSARALLGKDDNCENWIKVSDGLVINMPSASDASAQSQFSKQGSSTASTPLQDAIRRGLKSDSASFTSTLIAQGQKPVEIIDGEIVPALEVVGSGFEKGRVFLPQLLMSAEAASAAFEVIKAELARTGVAAETRGPIVIATVKGDIHDIGKNIVKALLENYSFTVIDLGRDVAPEKIVETIRESKARLVGLSALMTTTVPAMAETIRQIKEAGLACKVIVGGAVLTQEYANRIGADYYAKDAMQTVRIAESIF